eukprot:6178610-Pleurochrysis_carterae.AAC.1
MYLSHHRSIGLRFARSASALEGFSDSDWATRHLSSGYVFMYNRAAISRESKKQPPMLCRLAKRRSSLRPGQPRKRFCPWTTSQPSISLTLRSTINAPNTSIDDTLFCAGARRNARHHSAFCVQRRQLGGVLHQAAGATPGFCASRQNHDSRSVVLAPRLLARGSIGNRPLILVIRDHTMMA